MAWLLPSCLGLPKQETHTFLKSLKLTFPGSRRIISRIFSICAIGSNGAISDTICQPKLLTNLMVFTPAPIVNNV